MSKEEEEDEEESHVSEGQLIPSAQSYSDDSDISEEIIEGQRVLMNIDHEKLPIKTDIKEDVKMFNFSLHVSDAFKLSYLQVLSNTKALGEVLKDRVQVEPAQKSRVRVSSVC